MTTDEVLEWIAIRSANIAFVFATDRAWNPVLNGQLTILEELRHHILMKTNPHNREDIRKVNERNE